MRDLRTITPSPRRSTAISRGSHSILRKAGFSSTAAAFPLILRLPKYRPMRGSCYFQILDSVLLREKHVNRRRNKPSARRCAPASCGRGQDCRSLSIHLGEVLSTSYAERTLIRRFAPPPPTREEGRAAPTSAPCGWRRRDGWS